MTLLLFCVAGAQDRLVALRLANTPIEAESVAGYDHLGAVYYTRDNVFHKDFSGQSLEYKNLSLGKIRRIDLQNPLKIMLFYEDFNTVITLDNQLNETLKISFSNIAEPLVVSAAGMASQNRFWIYDSVRQQLGLFDYLKNDAVFIAPPLAGTIRAYDTGFNFFQWIDDQGNWYTCDVYGKVQHLGKVPESDQFSFAGPQTIVYADGGRLYLYDAGKSKKYLIENIDKSSQSFFLKDQILSIFTGSEIINYKISLP
ncbi:hypothetical protein HYN48_05770 [Flavobacterium magnum]|uniref:Uncharacterized protein n=2 Tax=Flavobacterium magnum TaxID=2162713 RepID=A0A2S0REA9_9FLAO|nr:hypothetical protein HYN48_05770 [Flavobacterium magnum]